MNHRELIDRLNQISEMQSKVFPKVFNDDDVLVADDPDSALELIADEVSEEDVDMYMDEIRAGEYEALIDALDGFGYRMKFIGDPMSRYNEEDEADLPGMGPDDAVTGSDNHIMGKGGHPVLLLAKVADQIAKDHANDDYTAIDELFKRTPSKELESFLSEFGDEDGM